MKKSILKMAASAVTAALMLQFTPLGMISASSDVAIDSTNFPDDTFRAYVSSNFDTDSDGSLSQTEMDAVTAIRVSGTSSTPNTVADLTGIEYFTKLETLNCIYNQLTSLNVSKNTALKTIYCYRNQLTSLDVSKNTALEYLNCQYNQLTSLDVSNNTALEHLYCSNNQLTSLDVSNNTALIGFSASNNSYPIFITGEEFSMSELPKGFDPSKVSYWANAAYDSETNSLKNIKKNTVTYTYDCGYKEKVVFTLVVKVVDDPVKIVADTFPDDTFRQYVADNFDKNGNCSLSQAEMDAVYYIDVSGTSSTPNNVADLTGIEYFTNLKKLYCQYNFLTKLDVSNNTALEELKCYDNKLTRLNVSNNTALTDLLCYNNQLTSLNVSQNKALRDLRCGSNQITSIILSNNTALEGLECNNNQLTSINVSNNTALVYFNCQYNQLTSLDVSNNTALRDLRCGFNQITNIILSNNTALTTLYCNNNQLTSLDLSKNTALTALNCSGNNLTSLDVSKSTALLHLYCNVNSLTKLDVSQNTALTELDCNRNQLTSLNVSNNTALTQLNCYRNQLTSLDLSNNTALSSLNCSENYYTIVIPPERSFSLSDLPAGFDPEKASDWTGATYDPATNSLKNFTSDSVYYVYDCGNGRTVTFTLMCTTVKISSVVVNSDNVAVTYSDDTSKTYSFDEVTKEIVAFMSRLKYDGKLCIDFVNAFTAAKEGDLILTDAQLDAIDFVIKYDNHKFDT